MEKIVHRFIKIKDLNHIAIEAKNNEDRYPFLPITEIRALAQMKNPVADKEDIGLILIYYDKKCVGYLGLLPCLLKKGTNVSKVYIFSAFFVDVDHREFKIAYRIMELAFSLGYDFFFSGYTDAFYKFSVKNPQWFKKIHDTCFLQINLDLVFPAIVKMEKKRRDVHSIFYKKPLVWFARFSLFLIRRLSKEKLIKRVYENKRIVEYSVKNDISIKPVKKVHVFEGFVSKLFENHFYFYRNEKVINWMIKNPWISEDPAYKTNYFFSDWRKLFRYYAFEFFCNRSGDYLGFCVYSVSKKGDITTLKILDNEVTKEENLMLIVEQSLKLSEIYSVDKMIAPDYLLETIEKVKSLKPLTIKKANGNFLGPANNSVFPSEYQKIKLQYCDADIPFS